MNLVFIAVHSTNTQDHKTFRSLIERKNYNLAAQINILQLFIPSPRYE